MKYIFIYYINSIFPNSRSECSAFLKKIPFQLKYPPKWRSNNWNFWSEVVGSCAFFIIDCHAAERLVWQWGKTIV